MLHEASWADIAAQTVFHTLVASLFVEALVRSWGVAEPSQRMAMRLVALVYPLAIFPLVLVAFPVRADEGFRESWALVVGRRWEDVSIAGVGLFRAWVLGLGAAGLVLLLMDLVPVLGGRRRPRPVASDPDPAGAAIGEIIAPLAAALGIETPSVISLDREAPLLFCTGLRRQAIVISRGAIALLDRAELRAALAHELAHVARRDPAASWGVMAARIVMAFNPAYQVVARAIARDAEALADERAAALCGDRLALASGLLKLWRTAHGATPPVRRTLPFAAALAEPLSRVRTLDIEQRCRRLLDPPPRPLPFPLARVALAGLSLTALLFFVV